MHCASLTVFSHRFSMAGGFMRKPDAGRFGRRSVFLKTARQKGPAFWPAKLLSASQHAVLAGDDDPDIQSALLRRCDPTDFTACGYERKGKGQKNRCCSFHGGCPSRYFSFLRIRCTCAAYSRIVLFSESTILHFLPPCQSREPLRFVFSVIPAHFYEKS